MQRIKARTGRPLQCHVGIPLPHTKRHTSDSGKWTVPGYLSTREPNYELVMQRWLRYWRFRYAKVSHA